MKSLEAEACYKDKPRSRTFISSLLLITIHNDREKPNNINSHSTLVTKQDALLLLESFIALGSIDERECLP